MWFTLEKGIHGPLPPNRVTASLTDPKGGLVSITALKLTRRIPGGGVEEPLPVGPRPNGSECETIWGLVSAIHGVRGTASEAGSGASAIEEEKWVQFRLKLWLWEFKENVGWSFRGGVHDVKPILETIMLHGGF